MKILTLNTNEINQNGYHINKLTRNKIGFIYIAPANIIPDDCLACDGYVLKISDYKKLYLAIGKTYNTGVENDDEFRIPDYNITGRFLQPGVDIGTQVAPGLPQIPNHTHEFMYSEVHDGTGRPAIGSQNYGPIQTGGISYIAGSDIYGKSLTVQPPSQIVLICIKYK